MIWDVQTLWQQLSPLLPGIGIEVVESVASTNSALLERARGPSVEGERSAWVRRSIESSAFGRRAIDWQPCLLIAEQQTAGRGRLGRSWCSAAGASLTFSLALPLTVDDWSGLSLAVGVALAEALDPEGDASLPRVGVKWPNDLWLIDPQAPSGIGRKLGGVLVETVSAGALRRAVIGVGINVQTAPGADLRELSSGFAALDELPAAGDAAQALSRVALPLVEAVLLFERAGLGPFIERFARRDLLLGRRVTAARAPGGGIACGVAPNGALLVRTDDDTVLKIDSGEVGVRPQPTAADRQQTPAEPR